MWQQHDPFAVGVLLAHHHAGGVRQVLLQLAAPEVVHVPLIEREQGDKGSVADLCIGEEYVLDARFANAPILLRDGELEIDDEVVLAHTLDDQHVEAAKGQFLLGLTRLDELPKFVNR